MPGVKICGISQIDHALAVAEAGADFIGVVMAASPRRVTPEKASEIAKAVRAAKTGHRPALVGVFVNVPTDEVNRITLMCDLDYVQLSGDETLEYCGRIKKQVIKAIHVKDGQTTTELEAELGRARTAGVLCLLDTKLSTKYGGGGRSFDWQVAKGLSDRFDFVLAGGLTPDNVAEAISVVHPWAVDVSSGVESAGVKDLAKIRAFIKAAKSGK